MSEQDGVCAIVPRGQNGFRPQVLGMAILVGDREIVTCAHVIDVALDQEWLRSSVPATVRICFPFAGLCVDGIVDKERWFPAEEPRAGEPSDIAVIQLIQDAPLSVVRAELQDHQVDTDAKVYGFRGKEISGTWKSHPDGEWALGKIVGPTPGGRAQFDGLRTGAQVEKGFSGSGVFDPMHNAIVGMIVESDRDTNKRIAQFIDVASLRRALGENPVNDPIPRIVGGFQDVRRLLNDETVADLLRDSRDFLEKLSKEFQVLEKYKSLHDCLHRLQFELYAALRDDVKRMRDDPAVRQTLNEYIGRLRSSGAEALSASTLLPRSLRQVEIEWVKNFQSYVEDLNLSVLNLNDGRAVDAVRSIGEIIHWQPTRINQEIFARAKDLTLDRLIDTVERVKLQINKSGNLAKTSTSASANILTNMIRGLHDLQGQLGRLLEEHNHWTQVECMLWSADQSIIRRDPEALEDFSFFWSAARKEIDKLCGEQPEANWSKNAIKKAAELQEKLSAGSPDVRQTYRDYRRTALERFVDVNLTIKTKLGEIVQDIGPELTSILKKLPVKSSSVVLA